MASWLRTSTPRRRFSIHAALITAVLLLVPAGRLVVRAQSAAAPTAVEVFNPQDPIPFDTSIRTATLPNGLAYFIRENGRPAKRVSLRLAVRAGSIEETDDQQGLAHLIEHMAFQGSAHFRPGEVLSYFESVGARLGPHVNATTNFDDTVYMLDLPSDKPEVIERGLTAFADFAGGLTLGSAELEKERGVVIEEWRTGLGAGSRVRDKQLPILLYQSRYAERLPIGKPDIVRSAPVDRLRAFYDTWYRPERMAVVVVGDIDPRQIERSITSIFSPLKARAAAALEPDRRVPLNRDLLVSVVTDPEVTQSIVQIVRKRGKQVEAKVADYRRQLVERLVQHMFDERFGELVRKPDAKILGAAVSQQGLTSEASMFAVGANVRDGGLEAGLRVLAVETTRTREFGFTQSELDRAKKALSAVYERAYVERDKSESGSFASELLRHFLVDEPVPGIVYEYRLAGQVLAGISTAEVTATARALLADDSRIVLAVAPRKESVSIPSDTELRSALVEAEHTAVTAWNDTTVSRALVDPKPTPGAIVSRRELKNLGVTVVRFANGVEAWLKPTDFKNDQVLFSMEASGGTSLAAPADFTEASLSPVFVVVSGAGGLKAADLQKILTGKRVSTTPFASLSAHGISGSAAPTDLEAALQLLYQVFTAPGDDSDAFALMKRRLETAVSNRGQAPLQVFTERLAEINMSNHYTAVPPTPERINALDREKIVGFFKQRFTNAADFAFVMVGAFKVDEATQLLAQYVGSLPSTGARTSQFKDVSIHFPTAEQRVVVEKGQEPTSRTVISFFADPPPDSVEQENVNLATVVVEGALREILRESLGQTYSVSVKLSQLLPQRGAGHISVSFAAAPENLDGMTERVLQEIKRLQREGPSADSVERAKQVARRADETSLKQNAHWMSQLMAARMRGTDPAAILQRPERIERVTAQTVQQAIQRYFPFDRFTQVSLVPAQAGAGGEIRN
jgi:zinc protease